MAYSTDFLQWLKINEELNVDSQPYVEDGANYYLTDSDVSLIRLALETYAVTEAETGRRDIAALGETCDRLIEYLHSGGQAQ